LVEQVGAVDARNLGELVGYSPTRSSGASIDTLLAILGLR
jgi:hypothetical protein